MKGVLYTTNFAKLNKSKGLKISIARFNPKWLDLKKYNVIWGKSLAPSIELLNKYKNKELEWFYFGVKYLDELCNSKTETVIHRIESLLDGGQDITLLCYEKSTDNCHRHILGNVFRDKGYKVKEI